MPHMGTTRIDNRGRLSTNKKRKRNSGGSPEKPRSNIPVGGEGNVVFRKSVPTAGPASFERAPGSSLYIGGPDTDRTRMGGVDVTNNFNVATGNTDHIVAPTPSGRRTAIKATEIVIEDATAPNAQVFAVTNISENMHPNGETWAYIHPWKSGTDVGLTNNGVYRWKTRGRNFMGSSPTQGAWTDYTNSISGDVATFTYQSP